MADTAHNTLRRDFLKGMMVSGALLPLAGTALAGVPAGAHDVQARWNAAMANLHAKKAASDLDSSDAVLDEYCAASDRLLFDTVAPDMEALRLKLAMVADRFGDGWLEDHLYPAILRDAAHLAGGVA